MDTAGAWDDEQFVSDLWQHLESIGEEVPGYRTYDGAVVFDRTSCKITKIEE